MSKKDKLIEKIETYPIRKDITFKELVTYLSYFDFAEQRVTGSHHIFKGIKGDVITIKDGKPMKCAYIKDAVDIVHKE